MLALLAGQQVHLPPAGRTGTQPATDPEENRLRDIPEVEADATPVASSVLAYFVPDEHRFIDESPGAHDLQPVAHQRIGNPEIQMGGVREDARDRDGADLVGLHRVVAIEPTVLR